MAPFDVEPRNVLNRVWQALRQRGLFPVAAVELEFYLIDRLRDAEGDLQPPCAPGTQERNTQSQVYSVDNLNHFAEVLNDIDALAKLQGCRRTVRWRRHRRGSSRSTCVIPTISCWPATTRWR